MRVDVIMPQMGESVAEGTVTKWLKKVGDAVARDEPLFEISTDKVDAEIPAPAAGFLTEILVGEGITVEINTRVAVISSDKSAVVAAEKVPPAAAGPAVAAPAPAAATPSAATPSASSVAASAVPSAYPGISLPSLSRDQMDAADLRRHRSSPLVRNIAREHGVDLAGMQGSGLSGRVTKKDILGYLETRPAASQPVPPSPAAAASPLVAAVRQEEGVKGARSAGSMDIPAHFLASPGPRDSVVAMTPMRRKIAEHMSWSKQISAHVNSFLEVDMTPIVRLRQARKEEFLARTGEKLTYMPFILQAAISALQAWPDCNSSIVGEEIITHKDIHLGVAVALDWGLIVPVIKHAGEKNLLGLTRTMNDLAGRARSKKLSPDEVAGGTFTVTNPGAFGSLTGTPIISQPQVAILGVGAINKRPWVMEGPEGDSIAIRHIMMLSLSYDHRLVDGATGARFLDHMRSVLESYDPSQMG